MTETLRAVFANGGDITAGVLALILLWFAWYTYRRIVAGDLVPRTVHDDVRRERDLWRQAAEQSASQQAQLIDSLQVTRGLLQTLQERLREGP